MRLKSHPAASGHGRSRAPPLQIYNKTPQQSTSGLLWGYHEILLFILGRNLIGFALAVQRFLQRVPGKHRALDAGGDMGNALTFFFIFLCMAFAAGFALRWFALLFLGGGAAFAAAWALELIPSYMMARFRVLFDHSYDALKTGWQQTRSLLAIGSGGVFGQGYMQGTQTQSSESYSLPYRWTDFIFSVCGEELGLIGCLAVIALLTAIIIRVLLVARNAQVPLHCYVCVGMAAMLIYQTVINIGMCLFVMPTIGVTLPFFSYGGSSLLTLYAAMGVVSGIKKRSPVTRRPGSCLLYTSPSPRDRG